MDIVISHFEMVEDLRDMTSSAIFSIPACIKGGGALRKILQYRQKSFQK